MKKDVIVCIGTVGRPTFDKCYGSVMTLKAADSRVERVEIIKNHTSQASWLNMMRKLSVGYTWCLQVDEDMYVNDNSVDILINLAKQKELRGIQILNSSGLLFDLFLRQNIGSLKLWRSSAMKRLEFRDVLGCDRDMHRRASKLGYRNVSTREILGFHDSVPTLEIGCKKYYTYIKKMIKFNGSDRAKRFIVGMEKKDLNESVIKESWRSYYENIDT